MIKNKIEEKVTEITKLLNDIQNIHVNSNNLSDLKTIPLLKYELKKNKFYRNQNEPYFLYQLTKDVSVLKKYINLSDKETNIKFYVLDCFNELELIHKENQLIIEKNKETLKLIHDFLINIGLVDYRYESINVGRGKSRTEQRDSYWYSELKQQIQIEDTEWKSILSWKNQTIETINWYFDKLKQIELEKQKETERELLISEAIQYLNNLDLKLGIEFTVKDAVQLANEKEFSRICNENGYKYGEYSGNFKNMHVWE